MSFIEEEYLRRVSYRLPLFKSPSPHKFTFRCPICGDSQKKKNKVRGFAKDYNGRLICSCLNCNHTFKSFPKFLEQIDPELYKQFIVEAFKKKMEKEVRSIEDDYFAFSTKKYIPNIFSPLEEVKDLPDENLAKKYVTDRKLPIDSREIYYVDKFVEWTKGHSDKFDAWRGEDHPRIIIPFKARDGHYIGYTARSINGEEPKYIRIFIDAEEKERFYGIDLLDETKQVYVLEGEIDSMFIPNAIAVSNGKLDTYYNPSAIYIPDADKRNPHIVKGIQKLIDRGLKVCLFPDDAPGKDINMIIESGYSFESLMKMIHNSVYQGLTAKLKFNSWSKV
jgi:transcription elongation factor Elf1